jgi:hypothetical protein
MNLLIWILAVLLLLAVGLGVAILVGRIAFTRRVHGELDRLFEPTRDRASQGTSSSTTTTTTTTTITEEEIAHLPPPVQRYMRFSGVVGRHPVRHVRLRQRGRFRTKPGGGWMKITAEQYYAVDEPGLIWIADAGPRPLSVRVRDMLLEGRGRITVMLLSLLRVGDLAGPELDQGVMLRYLSEMIWFPTALLGPTINRHVRWEPTETDNDSSARAIFTLDGREVSATFYFDERGAPVNLVAERYFESGGSFTLETWSTPIEAEFRELSGLRIPTRGRAVWHLDSGEFCYADLEIVDVEYDVPRPY